MSHERGHAPIGGWLAGLWRRRRRRRAEQSAREPRWVPVAIAQNQPEAELLASILAEIEVPVLVRRTGGFDVPEMLAAGPRELLVPAEREIEARALLEPLPEDEG